MEERGERGKEREQSLGLNVFDATTNHYNDGQDNKAVGTMMARTMTARTTKATLTTMMTTTARTTPVFDATTNHDEEGKDNNSKYDDGEDR